MTRRISLLGIEIIGHTVWLHKLDSVPHYKNMEKINMTTNYNTKATVNTQYDFETWLEAEYGYSYEDYKRMSKFEKSSIRNEYNAQLTMN